MSEYVLDASALLALLNDEPGAKTVQACLPQAVVSAVNLAEVSARLTAIGMPAAEIRHVLNLLGLEIIPFDEETALQSGFLYNATSAHSLSLGDRACLTLARRTGRIALTADRSWTLLNLDVEVRLIRPGG